MTSYHLTHRHAPNECRVAYAAWKGFESPLRHRETFSSCAEGGHLLWWIVEADDELAALAQLPPFIAERTHVRPVSTVTIP